MSHDWGAPGTNCANHAVIKGINTALKEWGVVTWFDDEDNFGNIRQVMAHGVQSSAIFILFLTANYEAKVDSTSGMDNCQAEFNNARSHLGTTRMLPVVMEAAVRGRAWAGDLASLSQLLYVDAVGCDADAVAIKIIAELRRMQVYI